jgi:hypothetical protein
MEIFTPALLQEALLVRKSMVKMRVVRSTIHVIQTSAVPYVFAATGDNMIRKTEQYTRRVGVPRHLYEHYASAILHEVSGNGLTANEIRRRTGISGNISGIISLLCDEGRLIRALRPENWKSNQHIYYNTSTWMPRLEQPVISREEGIEFLLSHYLRSYGPVSEEDIVWWTGMGKTTVRQSMKRLGGKVCQLNIGSVDVPWFMLRQQVHDLFNASSLNRHTVNLLPAMDPYIMGYKRRERYALPDYMPYLFDRSGNAANTILIGGKVEGLWEFVDKPETRMLLFFFSRSSLQVLEVIRQKTNRICQMFGTGPAALMITHDVQPLTERTAGSFMSPLRNSKNFKIIK